MKVCFLSREYPIETAWGGIGTYTHNISQALAEQGHEVHVISMSPRAKRTYLDGSVLVRRLYHRKRIRGAFPDRILYSFKVWRHVLKLIKEEGIDILEFPDYYSEGLFLSTQSPIPLVVRCHTPTFLTSSFSGWRGLPRAIDDRLAGILELIVIESATKVTCCSKALSYLIAKRCRIDLSTIEIIPNGIDTSAFDRVHSSGFRKALCIPNEDPVILFLGMMNKLKGMELVTDLVPRILQDFPNVFFVFVGKAEMRPGHYERKIKRALASSQKRRVIFAGPLYGTYKIRAIKESDFLIVPSLFENFPYVCLEAMACSKPVVASRVGGIPEIVEDGKSGLTFNPTSISDFENCVARLLQDEDERLAMGRNARRILESKFTSEVTAKMTVQVYEEVMANT
jgi:glycogen(starch) synthase